MTVQPFEINIEPAVLDDLRDRLRHPLARRDRRRGLGLRHERLCAALLRAHLAGGVRLANPADPAQPVLHLRVDVDGLGVHALHAKAADGAGLPLVLLHGWPSSFVQMLPIVPLLTTGADPFDVVALSLPGYGFSDRPRQRGMDVTRIADIVVEVMAQLGYPRFGARGATSAPAYCNNSHSTIPTGSSRCICPAPTPTSAGSPTTSVPPSSSSSPTRSSGIRPRWPTP